MFNSLDKAQKHRQFSDLRSHDFQQLSALADSCARATPEDEYDPVLWLNLALDLLIEGDFQTRWDVAKLLPRFGAGAIAPLAAILEEDLADDDTDWELLWFIVRTLSEFDHPTLIDVLVNLLKTSNGELGAAAAEALSNQGSKAIGALTQLLATPEFRLLAVRSLSRIRNSATIAPLLSVVDDPQPEIRAAAIEALISFHDPRILPVLIKALQDPVALVRREALTGLGLRTDLQTEVDLVDLLTPHLADLDLSVCRQAAIALGRMGNAAAEALISTLRSPCTAVALQIEIVRSLSWTMTADILKALHDLLPIVSTEVYSEIIVVLGKVDDSALQPQAAEVLTHLLKAEPSVQSVQDRQAIALSLGRLGETKALESLIWLLADSNPGVRLHAIAALKQLDPDTAYEQLKALVKDQNSPKALQQGVAIALQEW